MSDKITDLDDLVTLRQVTGRDLNPGEAVALLIGRDASGAVYVAQPSILPTGFTGKLANGESVSILRAATPDE